MAGFEFLPSGWGYTERALYEDAFTDIGARGDTVSQALFDAGFFTFGEEAGRTQAIREALYDYVFDEYGVNFNEIFDWQAWREQYEGS
jgi:hypothetical protein